MLASVTPLVKVDYRLSNNVNLKNVIVIDDDESSYRQHTRCHHLHHSIAYTMAAGAAVRCYVYTYYLANKTTTRPDRERRFATRAALHRRLAARGQPALLQAAQPLRGAPRREHRAHARHPRPQQPTLPQPWTLAQRLGQPAPPLPLLRALAPPLPLALLMPAAQSRAPPPAQRLARRLPARKALQRRATALMEAAPVGAAASLRPARPLALPLACGPPLRLRAQAREAAPLSSARPLALPPSQGPPPLLRQGPPLAPTRAPAERQWPATPLQPLQQPGPAAAAALRMAAAESRQARPARRAAATAPRSPLPWPQATPARRSARASSSSRHPPPVSRPRRPRRTTRP